MKKLLTLLSLVLAFNLGIQPALASSAVITFQDHAVKTTSGVDSYTFSAQAIGTATSDRVVLVAVNALILTSADAVPTVTIGGISATLVAHKEGATDTTAITAIYEANVPSGTTADVVVTKGGTHQFNRAGDIIWTMTGVGNTPTAYSTGTAEGTSVTISTTVNIAKGGVVAASSYNSATGAGQTSTWTGLATKDVDETISGNVVHSGAHDSFANAASNATVQDVWTGSTNQDTLVVVSYQPSNASTFNQWMFSNF